MPAIPILRDVVIAGTSFRDPIARQYAKIMPDGTLLKVEAEPTNAHDPLAVKVLTPDNMHLGYVPRESSGAIALLLTEGVALRVEVTGTSKAGFKTITVSADEA
jgi:hypothetical protein